MKRYKKYLLFSFVAIITLASCTTQKNTWLTRGSAAFTTRYNIYFNATQAFNAGTDAINNAQKDNYSQLLPMYPISVHSNADAGRAKMDIVIEKCRKAIKLKSIKVKPKKNPARKKDPAYIAFMNKEEYNPMVLRSWNLLAQAEFYKTDFLGAIGTYAYILNHFGTELTLTDEAQIGRARSFAEMGWNYEAEDALNKVSTKSSLNKKVNGLYAAATADLFIKEKRYPEAILYLKTAADNESNRFLQARFYFILGQLSTRYGDKETAFDAFTGAIRASKTYGMELAARLQRAQVTGNNIEKVMAELKKMAKAPRNKEYVDQIYVVIGNIYLNNNQQDKAIESYLAVINSKNPDSPDKMTANIRLGDFYYSTRKYLKAQPYYATAAKQIKSDNDDLDRVTKRADVLNELAGYSNTVHLQDSLQHLAKLPEKERLEAINKLIANIKLAEQAALAAKQKEMQQFMQQGNNRNLTPGGFGQNTGNSTTTTSSNSWYFYNPNTVQSGIAQFQQTWGNRKLEDDWRRADKSNISNDLQSVAQNNAATGGTTKEGAKKLEDKYDPAFYLAQLPSTPADFAKSNGQISKSLFNMGQLYEYKLTEDSLALAAYAELYRRFGVDSLWIEAYYSMYKLNEKAGRSAEAQIYKNLITAKFPSTTYGQMLSFPDYAERQRELSLWQDSLYEKTFMAYTRNEFQTVIDNYQRLNSNYPFASLMPKFALLNALSVGKNGDQDAMRTKMEDIVKKYPQSDVAGTVKDMLALLGQGKMVAKGGTYGDLMTKQQASLEQQANQPAPAFTVALNSSHYVLLPVISDTLNINRLVFNIASYNFNSFVLKDFDLEVKYLSPLKAVLISDFPTFGDARYYMSSLSEVPALSKTLTADGIRPVAISDDNLKAILAGQTFSDYLKFYQGTLIPAQAAEDAKNRGR